jgi:prepilin-type N-terminal cleavage/methylation domain-containing protein
MRLQRNNFRLKFPMRLGGGRCRAFTLIEMLVVLIIIALLAALALPHIRGNQESVAINAACRQLVDDLSFARQKAMSIRGTIAVVFVGPALLDSSKFDSTSSAYTPTEQEAVKRLQGGIYTHYALYQYRSVGEQPGSYASKRYITEWKSLPDKTFIDTNSFPVDYSPANFTGLFLDQPSPSGSPTVANAVKFPFPFSTSVASYFLPYIAFDGEGRCVQIERDETGAGISYRDVWINVARGPILYSRLNDGTVDPNSLDVQQIPPYNATNNTIHIDFLTGRAERLELQLR